MSTVKANYDKKQLIFIRGAIWALREEWKKLGKSVVEFDEKVGIRKATMLKFIKGDMRPRPLTVIKICEYLGINIETVITNYKNIYKQKQHYIDTDFKQETFENPDHNCKNSDIASKFNLTDTELEQILSIFYKLSGNHEEQRARNNESV